jgi:hypothetical protein
VATKRVQDPKTAIMQELKDITSAENTGATTRKLESTFEEMFNAIQDIPRYFACSDNELDGDDFDDDEEDTVIGKLCDDDGDPGRLIGPISKAVEHRMERFRQKHMRLPTVSQPGWGDTANYFRERDMKYGTAQLKVLAVVKPKNDTTAATPSPTTFGEQLHNVDIAREQLLMPAVTSRPGSSQMRLGSDKQQ